MTQIWSRTALAASIRRPVLLALPFALILAASSGREQTGVSQLAAAGSGSSAPTRVSPPAGTARIWFYRNDGPYDSQQRPFLRLNGRVAGIVEPNGAFYRDVPPGHYAVTADSYGTPYANQFAELSLGAGQQAFIKVLSMRESVTGSQGDGSRALFFTRLVPPDVAQPAIAGTPFYGGG